MTLLLGFVRSWVVSRQLLIKVYSTLMFLDELNDWVRETCFGNRNLPDWTKKLQLIHQEVIIIFPWSSYFSSQKVKLRIEDCTKNILALLSNCVSDSPPNMVLMCVLCQWTNKFGFLGRRTGRAVIKRKTILVKHHHRLTSNSV